MTDTLRLPYRVVAASATEAIQAAKVQCRAEGWTTADAGRLRTLAGARPAETAGQWIVTLVVRPKVAP